MNKISSRLFLYVFFEMTPMKKRMYVVVAIFAVALCNMARAQDLESNIQKYLAGDTIQAKSELLWQYRMSDGYGQHNMRQQIVSMVTDELTEENRFRASALIMLYTAMVDSNDAYLPALYYIAGDISAGNQDTVGVKNSIFFLERYYQRTGAPVDAYVNMLNDYLMRFRHMVPTDKLEGYWISNFVMDGDEVVNTPYLILKIQNENEDSSSAEIMEYCQLEKTISKYMSGNFESGSQLVKSYGRDSLYILWASQKVVNKSDLGVTLLRSITNETASLVVANYSQRNKYSLEERLAAQALTGLVEMGVNALLDEMFMPKRKDYVMQARLCVKNDRVMTGKIYYSTSMIRADGRGVNNAESIDVTFLRWDAPSNVGFVRRKHRPMLPDDMSVWRFKRDESTEFHQAFSLPKSRSEDFRWMYNVFQIGRLISYNDSLLRSNGVVSTCLVESDSSDYCVTGFDFIGITPDVKSKYFLSVSDGVMVNKITKLTPAYFTALHRGDVIVAVDGNPIITEQDMKSVEFSNGRKVTLSVFRGPEEMEIEMTPMSRSVYKSIYNIIGYEVVF